MIPLSPWCTLRKVTRSCKSQLQFSVCIGTAPALHHMRHGQCRAEHEVLLCPIADYLTRLPSMQRMRGLPVLNCQAALARGEVVVAHAMHGTMGMRPIFKAKTSSAVETLAP